MKYSGGGFFRRVSNRVTDAVEARQEKRPHIASLDTDSKPGILFRYMLEHKGVWIDGHMLARRINHSTAIASHISAVLQQLRLHPELGLECPRAQQRGVGLFFYCVQEVEA